MNPITILVLAVVVVAVVLLGFWLAARRKRSTELREHFGPEYDRAVDEYGDTRPAEDALAARAKRVEQLHIRELTPDEGAHYAEQWRTVQADFVDDPELAVAHGDQLVGEVMQLRGYPVSDFEQRAADVSVDHPLVVENYRAAHSIAGRSARGEAQTEDLRQAMVHYRTLFEDLIGTREHASQEARR